MLLYGFKRSEYDSCVYIKIIDGSPIYLLLYVDDMLIAAKSIVEITTLKKLLSSEFDMKDLGVDSCIDLFCDSQSAICLTKDQMFHERTKVY